MIAVAKSSAPVTDFNRLIVAMKTVADANEMLRGAMSAYSAALAALAKLAGAATLPVPWDR